MQLARYLCSRGDKSSIHMSVSYEEFRKSGKKLEQLGKSALYENI